jgi:hypothetical protein
VRRRVFNDPLTGHERVVTTDAPTQDWFLSKCDAFGLPGHIVASIWHNESRWTPFSDFGPVVAWNPGVFARIMLTKFKKAVPLNFSASYDVKLTGSKREQRHVWDSIALARKQYGDQGYEAALLATAFGLGQVMGANHLAAGAGSVFAFYELVWTSHGQALAALKFASQRSISQALKFENFQLLASLYAGSLWKDYYPTWPATIEKYAKYYKGLFSGVPHH